MFPPSKKPKKDFLDDVVMEMGPSGSKGKRDDDGGEEYGADLSNAPDEGDDSGGDDEEASQDRIMAAKQVGKAMGLPPGFDAVKLADALKAFVSAC